MAKFYGAIGFGIPVETSPGVWEDKIVVRKYYGETVRNTRKLQSTENLNDNVDISNDFSIVSDPYGRENFHRMRYIEFMGTKWKILNVEVQYPRLVLSVGGVYNGE